MELLSKFNRDHAAAMRKHFGDRYAPVLFTADVECPYCKTELKCDTCDDFEGVPFSIDEMETEIECPSCEREFKLSLTWLPLYEAEPMNDALDNLKPCPKCDREMKIAYEGLYCPNCKYLYCQEENETLVQTAEHFNSDRDNIAREIAFEVVE